MSINFDSPEITGATIKARLRVAIDREGIPFGELCNRAGITEDALISAVEFTPPCIYKHRSTLEPVCFVLGRDFHWLLTGNDEQGRKFKTDLKDKVKQLVWEYIYRAKVPKKERQSLVEFAMRRVDNLHCNTTHAAYRTGIPRTYRDIAFLHRAMNNNNH